MKKIRFLLPILCAFLCLSFTVSAHPGRLDSNGGHHDRIHGGYHYHRGENAGKVYNNDKEYTTRRTNYTYEYTTAERTEEHAETTQTEQQPNESLLVTIIGYILRIGIGTLIWGSAILPICLLFTFKKDSNDKILLKGYSSGLLCSVLNTIAEDCFNSNNYLWVILVLVLFFGILFAYQTHKKNKK